MFNDILKPKIKEVKKSGVSDDEILYVKYIKPGTFVFVLQGEELCQHSISTKEFEMFDPIESFLFLLREDEEIDFETPITLNKECDYKISFKIN